jgi:predicted CDP-diglyceride synthetase/phosphatidate cytidylyltransferase
VFFSSSPWSPSPARFASRPRPRTPCRSDCARAASGLGRALLFWIAWVAGPFVSTLLFGLVSFFALREFVTLTHTRRADHRAPAAGVLRRPAGAVLLVGTRLFNAFHGSFIPVYVFSAIPVISALANDPQRFLERTARSSGASPFASSA